MRKHPELTRFVPVIIRAAVCVNLIVLVAFTIQSAISRWSAGSLSASSQSVSTATGKSLIQSQAPEADVQGLVIAIQPTGFEPAEIEVTDGRYLFIVQNRSGIRDLAFRFDRRKGEKLHETRDQKLQWKKQFDLHPGTYVLSVVDHPEWSCVIRVKPH